MDSTTIRQTQSGILLTSIEMRVHRLPSGISNLGKVVGMAGMLTLLSACGNSASVDKQADTDNATNADTTVNANDTLHVLAGSELKDIEPMLADIQANTGVRLQLDYTGTLDGVEALVTGATDNVDAAWFSHGKYLTLVDNGLIKAQTPIMLSPVVLGVKQSKAQALGWLNDSGEAKTDITWQSIADAAKSGKFKYAMTNPASSNSGFTALMGVTSALAGTSDAPTIEDVQAVKPKLKDFFAGQALTSGSSGWLADAYLKQESKLDGIINYESVLMAMNQNPSLKDPLLLIYPKEGIVTADYPLMLLNNDKRAAYDKVVEYLKSANIQTKLMTDTLRRPANTQVALSAAFAKQPALLVELPFPNSQKVVDSLLIDYANELRNPAFAVFLLDTSGSMSGDGITQLKAAMLALTQASRAKGNARFAQFADNEVVALMPFSNVMQPSQVVKVNEQNLPKLKDAIGELTPRGGTAIYSALSESYLLLDNKMSMANVSTQSPSDTPYYYTIVLMTDGVNQDGIDYSEFVRFYNSLPDETKNIKVFPVLFGDADPDAMQQIAELTGGRVFDGRQGNLDKAFKEIRGYQ